MTFRADVLTALSEHEPVKASVLAAKMFGTRYSLKNMKRLNQSVAAVLNMWKHKGVTVSHSHHWRLRVTKDEKTGLTGPLAETFALFRKRFATGYATKKDAWMFGIVSDNLRDRMRQLSNMGLVRIEIVGRERRYFVVPPK